MNRLADLRAALSEDAIPIANLVQAASGGAGCNAVRQLRLGDVTFSSITGALPSRLYEFEGTAGTTIRIRMDALGDPATAVDPILSLRDASGQIATKVFGISPSRERQLLPNATGSRTVYEMA